MQELNLHVYNFVKRYYKEKIYILRGHNFLLYVKTIFILFIVYLLFEEM